MTTPPQPGPAAAKTIGQFLRPLREQAVYALLGAPAVFLFVAVIELPGSDFASFGGFVNVATVFFPLAAVLLALGVDPVHPKARLITMVALAEYAVASFFGVIFGVLFGVSHLAATSALAAFGALLARAAWLAVLALAAYAVVRIWLGLFWVPRPKPQPGVYGQPYQQPPYGSYGQPAPGSYGPPAPGSYGPPPVWGQPPVQPADPTQVVPGPAQTPAAAPIDRTSVLPENRPGFGPAGQDPPRQ